MADQDFDINIRTRADLSGVQQTGSALSDLQRRAAQIGPGAALAERDAAAAAPAAEEAGGSLAQHLERGFTRYAFHAAGIGLLLGLEEEIKKTAAQFEKITEELDKQGEQLVKNAQLYAEQAKSAQTDADVLKIGLEALKAAESTHKQILEIQKVELSVWQKLIDSFLTAIPGTQGAFTAALKAQQAQAEKIEDAARKNLVNAIELGKAYEEAFERRKAQPINDVILELTKHVADLENQLKGIDYTKFPESWVETEKNIERAKKQLLEFIEIQQRGQTGGPGGTSIVQPAAPPRTVAEWRADQAKATAEFQRTQGPQAISDWRTQQAKAMAEFQGQTPRFGGSSANDILAVLKDQNTLLRQQIDIWK
jgi:hypothetical protein